MFLHHLLILEDIYHYQSSLFYTTQELCIKFHNNPFGTILKVLQQFINLIVNVQQHDYLIKFSWGLIILALALSLDQARL